MLLIPETVELPNGALTEFQVQLLLQGYRAGINHAQRRDRPEIILIIFLVFALVWAIASYLGSKEKDALAMHSKHVPRDPLVETLVAMEEGRLERQQSETVHEPFLPVRDTSAQTLVAMEEGLLKHQECEAYRASLPELRLRELSSALAKEQAAHEKTESLVWKMGYWLRCRESDLIRANSKHMRAQQRIKVLQSDKNDLKLRNPCVLVKEKSRRGQSQYAVKKAVAAREMVMMRKFNTSTLRSPNTQLVAALIILIPAGAASFKLLDCALGSAMYVDLLGAAGRVNVGRALQDALIEKAM